MDLGKYQTGLYNNREIPSATLRTARCNNWYFYYTRNNLINGVLDGSYQVKIFCSEFTRIYDLEVDYEQLSELENKEFGDLCEW